MSKIESKIDFTQKSNLSEPDYLAYPGGLTSLGGARTAIKEMRVCDLRPADWNYKAPGTAEEQERLMESIKFDGSAGVLAVRWVIHQGDTRGFYEVIDGNHRLDAVIKAGWDTVFCEDFGTISDAEAVTLSHRRNKQWYDADEAKYARLFAEVVVPEISLDELILFMPDTRKEMENILAQGSSLFYHSAPDDKPERLPPPDGRFKTFTVTMPEDAYVLWRQLREEVEKRLAADQTPLHTDSTIANGQVIELLVADAILGRLGGLLD